MWTVGVTEILTVVSRGVAELHREHVLPNVGRPVTVQTSMTSRGVEVNHLRGAYRWNCSPDQMGVVARLVVKSGWTEVAGRPEWGCSGRPARAGAVYFRRNWASNSTPSVLRTITSKHPVVPFGVFQLYWNCPTSVS